MIIEHIAEVKMIYKEKPKITSKEVYDVVHMAKKVSVSIEGPSDPLAEVTVDVKHTACINRIKSKPTKAVQHKSAPSLNRTNENIEWAKWSWNPVVGCKHNCMYCYARDIAIRFYNDFEPR